MVTHFKSASPFRSSRHLSKVICQAYSWVLMLQSAVLLLNICPLKIATRFRAAYHNNSKYPNPLSDNQGRYLSSIWATTWFPISFGQLLKFIMKPESGICNVFFFQVSNFSFSLTSYLFMAGTCARWCHGSCAMLKGKLWRRLRRPGLSDVAWTCFLHGENMFPLLMLLVQDCTSVQDLLKCVDWNWLSMLWGKHDMFYGWGWIDGFLKSLEDMKKCVDRYMASHTSWSTNSPLARHQQRQLCHPPGLPDLATWIWRVPKKGGKKEWEVMRFDEIWWDLMRFDEIWWDCVFGWNMLEQIWGVSHSTFTCIEVAPTLALQTPRISLDI